LSQECSVSCNGRNGIVDCAGDGIPLTGSMSAGFTIGFMKG